MKIRYHSTFKKDYKRIVKRGYNVNLLNDIIQKLAKGEKLPEKIGIISLSGIMRAAVNATYPPTGF